MDVCRWALDVSWPTRVTSNGGRYAFQDDWETPDTQTISWDFAADYADQTERDFQTFTAAIERGAIRAA